MAPWARLANFSVILLSLACSGERPATSVEPAAPALTDMAGDGTPDFLVLDDQADRRAFVSWFTYLAESMYFTPPKARPAEVDDCGALLRFAYREALSEHDGAWANRLGLDAVPPVPPLAKYRYPHTPLGASLFRVEPGPFRPEDLRNGTFAQFADASTLCHLNTHFITRDIHRARPGDLLFFKQVDQEELPFHAMIFLGDSHFETGGGPWIVYHTGPTGDDPGEIRRRSVPELLAHPRPQWRPLSGNVQFLGIHRWNILREAL